MTQQPPNRQTDNPHNLRLKIIPHRRNVQEHLPPHKRKVDEYVNNISNLHCNSQSPPELPSLTLPNTHYRSDLHQPIKPVLKPSDNLNRTPSKRSVNLKSFNPQSISNTLKNTINESTPSDKLKELFLLQEKLKTSEAFPSLDHQPEDSTQCGELAYLMTKRLRCEAPLPEISWRRPFECGQTPVNRKRKRGVSLLDRRHILKCRVCGKIEYGGYKFGDYIICSECGNNDFLSVREWSPTRDGKHYHGLNNLQND